MATPADRGWGDPGRIHGDAQAREYGRHHITTIETSDGSRFAVRKEVAPLFRGLLEELLGRGYRIKGALLDDWGWYVRPIAGTTTLSNHSWGLAIDVNALTNPQGRVLTTDLPADIPGIAARWGLTWGGTYKSRPDGMHFERLGSRDDTLRFVRQLEADLAAIAAARRAQEDDMARHYEIVTVKPPENGMQLVAIKGLRFDQVAGVTLKANDNGAPIHATVQVVKAYNTDDLVLSFVGTDIDPATGKPKPVPPGNVGVVIAVAA